MNQQTNDISDRIQHVIFFVGQRVRCVHFQLTELCYELLIFRRVGKHETNGRVVDLLHQVLMNDLTWRVGETQSISLRYIDIFYNIYIIYL